MLTVYTVVLFALIGTGILPLSVDANSSKSSGSGDKNQKGYCKNSAISDKAVDEKIKFLDGCKAILPSCALLAPGAISKIDFYNGKSGKTTTVLTCSGCARPQVPISGSSDCKNVLDIFRHDLDKFCEVAFSQCKSITIYRCGSPAVSTTTERTTTTAAPTTTENLTPPPTDPA